MHVWLITFNPNKCVGLNKIVNIMLLYFQVKILNKLASAKASGQGTGSKVLTDMIEGLEDPEFAVELRLKIDQNHTDLRGGYVNTVRKF